MKTKNIRSLALVLTSTLVLLNVMPLVAMADNPVPFTTSISPNTVAVGGPSFVLTVNGSNFVSGSMVNINGSQRTTTYVSATQLIATINASDINTQGTYAITVTNFSPGGGTSNAQYLLVTSNNPVPVLSSISPASVVAGSGNFTLTVYGSNFNNSSVVSFNGHSRATTYISPNQLTATILASDVAVTGVQAIMVTNPGPGGGPSNMMFFTISPFSGTPGLPNTGFGPPGQPPSPDPKPPTGWNNIVALVAAILISGSLIGLAARKAWLVRK